MNIFLWASGALLFSCGSAAGGPGGDVGGEGAPATITPTTPTTTTTPTSAPLTAPESKMVAADVDAVPAALFRVVWLEGAWVIPPASGELADIEITGTAEEPMLVRRSGAGEEVWLITGRHGDGAGGLTATLRQPRGKSSVLRITPYEAPPAGVPAPPAGSWVVRIGGAPTDAHLAWVDTATRSRLRSP